MAFARNAPKTTVYRLRFATALAWPALSFLATAVVYATKKRMWSRHMNFPSRNVFAAAGPYTEPIDLEIATEFASSAFATVGNVGEPVTPAFVAFIASTACSPN